MKIYLGADHAGFELKSELKQLLAKQGHDVVDVGDLKLDPNDDYPQYAYNLVTKLLGEEGDTGRGILICGSGQGMSIAANRVRGIRAALAWDAPTGQAAKEDDDANVLVLSSRFTSKPKVLAAVEAWLEAKFKGDAKYKRRLDEIEQLYG